ncbi:MAG: FG-GAP-like repeat-containing protein [Saprospiraceae bacterium]
MGDYDRDGLVDLYVTNSAGTNKNLLYHNDGGNKFTKITMGTIVNDISDTRSVNWVDIDGDGDLDLFVTNENGKNEQMYRNDNNGIIFTKIAAGPLVSNLGNTMSSSWADYDNDGDLDVFLTYDGSSNALFRNEGSFNFTKMVSDTVSNTNAHSFSSAWSDIDNDGDLDLFVTNAFYTLSKQLSFLYLNNGDGSFARVSNTIPAIESSWSYGCAFGDYDNDGFEDLAVATVSFNSIDDVDFLYHNDGNSNNWITIKLVGTTTNRAAIGCKIRVKATINGKEVWQMREISAQSAYCSQNDLRAHFGLGDATSIDSIKVEWLGQATEIFTQIFPNQFITITQGNGILGLDEISPYDEMELFPNPAKSILNVKMRGLSAHHSPLFQLIDMKGFLASSGKIKNATIDIQDLSPGMYLLKVAMPGRTMIKRFIKI